MSGDWNDHWAGGWWWMTIMMVVFWVGVAWVVVTLVRRGNHPAHTHAPALEAVPPRQQTPQELLADRLARGEIEPDDYRQRLDALVHQSGGSK